MFESNKKHKLNTRAAISQSLSEGKSITLKSSVNSRETVVFVFNSTTNLVNAYGARSFREMSTYTLNQAGDYIYKNYNRIIW